MLFFYATNIFSREGKEFYPEDFFYSPPNLYSSAYLKIVVKKTGTVIVCEFGM